MSAISREYCSLFSVSRTTPGPITRSLHLLLVWCHNRCIAWECIHSIAATYQQKLCMSVAHVLTRPQLQSTVTCRDVNLPDKLCILSACPQWCLAATLQATINIIWRRAGVSTNDTTYLLTYQEWLCVCTSVTVPVSSAAERRTANSTRCPSFLTPSVIIPAAAAAAAMCQQTRSLAEHLLHHTNIC